MGILEQRRAFAGLEARRAHPDATRIFTSYYLGEFYAHVFLPGESGSLTYLINEGDMPDDQAESVEQYIVNIARLENGITQRGTNTKVFDEPVKVLTMRRYNELLSKAGEADGSGDTQAGD